MNKYSLVFIAIALFVVLSLQAQVKEASIEFRTCFDTESTEPAATVATCLSPYVWHHATFDVADGDHQTKDGYELTAKGCTCVVHMDVTFENHDETHPTVANWCDTYGVYEWRAQDNTLLGSYSQSTQAEVAHGTNAYGCPIIYTLDLTVNQCAPLGAINGKFSVSANKQVYFSKGNLQFCAKPGSNPKNYTHLIYSNTLQQQSGTTTSGGQWRFAEHQYDYVGATTQLASGETNTGNVYVGNTQSCNTYRSSNYSGYIDLFPWGSSSVSVSPYSTSVGNSTSLYNIDCFDWGYYNSIYYGNNQSSAVSEWRTPKAAEMRYLLKDRSGSGWSANNRMAMGTIEGQNGLILLPDVWTQPAGVPFRDYTNSVATQLSTNVYTASTWQQMEDRGAVFLPCAGMYQWDWYKWGGFNKYGGYWLRDFYSFSVNSYAYYFEFRTTTGVNITNINTDSGRASLQSSNSNITFSVRLIQDVQ